MEKDKSGERNPYFLYIEGVPLEKYSDNEIKEGYKTFDPYYYDGILINPYTEAYNKIIEKENSKKIR